MAPRSTTATPAKKPAPAPAAPAKGRSNVPAKIEPKSSAVGLPQSMANRFLQDANKGLERVTASDYALPFLYLLQKNSPQVDDGHPKYVEGAEPGMFLNTVTGELFERLIVIPVDFEKVFIEWIPRDAGGGFVAQYKDRNVAEESKREETQIVDTANHYVLVQSADGVWTPAILSMTSTKLKASRNWLSKMSMVNITAPDGRKVVPPTYARIYEVLPEGPVRNQKGTFYTIAPINPLEGEDGWVSDPEVYEQADNFFTQIRAGSRGADFSKMEATIVEEGGEEGEEGNPKF